MTGAPRNHQYFMEPVRNDETPVSSGEPAENIPGLLAFVQLDSNDSVTEATGESGMELGESLAFVRDVTEQLGESLGFDSLNSLTASGNGEAFYCTRRPRQTVAAVVEKHQNLRGIINLLENR